MEGQSREQSPGGSSILRHAPRALGLRACRQQRPDE
jgi:hypothetical protein